MEKEKIDIFLEKLMLLEKINKNKLEYIKGYLDAKLG